MRWILTTICKKHACIFKGWMHLCVWICWIWQYSVIFDLWYECRTKEFSINDEKNCKHNNHIKINIEETINKIKKYLKPATFYRNARSKVEKRAFVYMLMRGIHLTMYWWDLATVLRVCYIALFRFGFVVFLFLSFFLFLLFHLS